jgi:hypothetical protein
LVIIEKSVYFRTKTASSKFLFKSLGKRENLGNRDVDGKNINSNRTVVGSDEDAHLKMT